ncbi:hypothetical protein MICAK_750004 [Microcystis aeruginosa PCC 9701]|uniref:Uncharacterized protein n=1 Tax=Microcystis aeruginosa PCC 9701 TaxID=721123 RepID=I4IXC8_MICAE|nr:hypothetical protein MICAK_750004 [Microcystis aeruginosa PCC 9701]
MTILGVFFTLDCPRLTKVTLIILDANPTDSSLTGEKINLLKG